MKICQAHSNARQIGCQNMAFTNDFDILPFQETYNWPHWHEEQFPWRWLDDDASIRTAGNCGAELSVERATVDPASLHPSNVLRYLKMFPVQIERETFEEYLQV